MAARVSRVLFVDDEETVREALQRKQPGKDNQSGEDYAIPFLVVVDAFHSETVAYADLVLPDTTYLERWDCISLLDRPISEADGPADSIRQPVVEPERDVRRADGASRDPGVLEAAPILFRLHRHWRGVHRDPAVGDPERARGPGT